MDKCSLCGELFEDEEMEKQFEEAKSVGASYCPKCKKILKNKTKFGDRRNPKGDVFERYL
jgi:NAD-dependent SIR2 family protein deacetylase